MSLILADPLGPPVPSPTLAQVRKLVSTGQLRFFLVSGGGFGAGGGSTATAVDSWVASACTEVPAEDYSASATASPAGPLYVCSPSA